jgi:type VI secretion system protein ImpB
MAIQDEIPKSRLTLKYKTEVDGQPEDLSLPLRMLVTMKGESAICLVPIRMR